MSDTPSIAERIEHRRQNEVHQCVVPACGEQAREAFYVSDQVAGRGSRVAGRDWSPGDFIDLCPRHGLDLRAAGEEGEAGIERLREWTT